MSQYCRICGTDLRVVRAGLERLDAPVTPADSARAEIGRAVAEKIREMRGAVELKTVAEDVLPEIDKFLETPAEKRLRRMRAGVITSAAGLGAMLMFLLIGITLKEMALFFPAGAGLVAFVIGLGMIVNGKLLTAHKEPATDALAESPLRDTLERLPSIEEQARRELGAAANPPPSVTEHTTHTLQNEAAMARRLKSTVNDER